MDNFFRSIDAREAKRIVDEKKSDPDFLIIDVRTSQELVGGVIGEPINIDYYRPDFKEKLSDLDRQKTYLVYCRSGNRSKAAMEVMRRLKFVKVYELEDGIMKYH